LDPRYCEDLPMLKAFCLLESIYPCILRFKVSFSFVPQPLLNDELVQAYLLSELFHFFTRPVKIRFRLVELRESLLLLTGLCRQFDLLP